jgi:hypothetical protein
MVKADFVARRSDHESRRKTSIQWGVTEIFFGMCLTFEIDLV